MSFFAANADDAAQDVSEAIKTVFKKKKKKTFLPFPRVGFPANVHKVHQMTVDHRETSPNIVT